MKSKPPRRIARRAFTLLEALIAVGMIGLLAGALALFVDDLGSTHSRVGVAADRARSADALFATLETALQTAVVDGGPRGAGITGSAQSLHVLSSRTDATGSTAAQLARAAFAPLVVTEVRQSGKSVFVGRAGAATILPAEMGAVEMRYYDGKEWADSYDSLERGRLPVLVEVAVWFTVPESDAGVGQDAIDAEGSGVDSARGLTPRARTDALEALTRERPPPDRVRRIAVPDAAVGGAP